MPTSPHCSLGHADHRGLGDGGELVQHVLDLGRIDVLAAGNVHVLPAIDDVVEAFFVDPRGVAGMQPAVGEGRPVGVRPVPVAGRDVRSLDPEFAESRRRRPRRRRAARSALRYAAPACRMSRPCARRPRGRASAPPGWSRSFRNPAAARRRAASQTFSSGTGIGAPPTPPITSRLKSASAKAGCCAMN